MKPGVKICGITRLSDAVVALEAGADALGFVLADGSPRKLSVDAACALVTAVRRQTERPFVAVAVLGTYDVHAARHALERGFDRVQLHGKGPTADLLATLEALGDDAARAWGAVRVKDDAALDGLDRAPGEAVLLDAWDARAAGGTGRVFDWTLAADLARARRVVLAGGLDADNVATAIHTVRPWHVDVSSGVEASPGVKDPARIHAFIQAVARA